MQWKVEGSHEKKKKKKKKNTRVQVLLHIQLVYVKQPAA